MPEQGPDSRIPGAIPGSIPGPILETAIYASDLDAAEAFYGGVLGLDRISRGGNRYVFFRAGDGVFLVFNPDETAQPAAPGGLPVPVHGAHGPGHVCFRTPAADLDGLARRLAGAGVAIEADFLWPNGARSVYVRDPAGNSVEFADPSLWTA